MAAVPDRLTDALAGRYRIERLLGSGGMADVYLAQDLKHPRRVAIKVLKPELAAVLGRERFLREIELAARLQHPYIVALWDSGAAGDLLYYVMPFLEGDTLRQRLGREKQLPLEEAVRTTAEVAEALDYAHRQGVVHRDIKPENILFEGGHALVADFGIARAVGLAAGTQLTETGVSLGTPAYMSPEQALGGRELDAKSDQYSLACVAYEMLAGQPPFTGATAESVVHQHVAAPPRPVTDLRPAVPTAMGAALTHALTKAPADRFGSAGEFAGALAAGATGRVTPGLRQLSQRRLAIAGAGLVIAAGAVAAWWWSEFRGRAAAADPTQKDLILVAEFKGPADDPQLATAVRNMLVTAIDQSGIAASVPDAELRRALRSAGRPESTKVDAALARELAYRRSIRAVLEGHVDRLGAGHSIGARLVDVETDRVLISTSATAGDQRRLIPALQELGKRLRAALGERRAALRATRPLYDVTTPDFEAYLLHVRGRDASNQGDYERAARFQRAALDRDPQFGSAWRSLGAHLYAFAGSDSGSWAYEQALRCTGRLSDYERLNIEAVLARNRRDLHAWLEATERALRTNLTPSDLVLALNLRGYALATAGRIEEATEHHRVAMEASTWGPGEPTLTALYMGLVQTRKFEEARAIAERMRGRAGYLALLEVFQDRWVAAESVGTAVAQDTGVPLLNRFYGAAAAAAGHVARGRLVRAEKTLAEFRHIGETTRDSYTANLAGYHEAVLASFSGRKAPSNLISTDYHGASIDELAGAAFGLLAAGRNDEAATALALLQAHPLSKNPNHHVTIGLLQGWGALRLVRVGEARALLGPVALESDAVSYAWEPDRYYRQVARWLMADIYDRSGRPDSAAICLELMLAPIGPYTDRISFRGFFFSFAHQRLVLLYARMGRLEDTRRHWEVFAKAFDDPDPELRPLVDQARNALASAEAMAKSTRR